MKKLIALLETMIEDSTHGLPQDLFHFVTCLTPMVNVDLLIKDEQGQTLLTWRNDGFFPAGWHIPGGIIRYKETIADRICAVAANELGAKVEFLEAPLIMNEVIHPNRKIRGHFISLLYECTLISKLDESLEYKGGIHRTGEWAWHAQCPNDLIEVHEMYRDFL